MARVHIPFIGARATNASRTAIEDHARTIDHLFKDDFSRMNNLVRHFGGRISTADMGTHEIYLEVFGPSDFEIYNSPITGPGLDDYRTAIYLSHYLLHFPLTQKYSPDHGMQIPTGIDHPHAPPRRASIEAIWFASELVMPEAKMREIFAKHDFHTARDYFRVPQSYLRRRAESLGLIETVKEDA